MTVGIHAPGAMGAALGACLRAGDHQVLASLTGRSAGTVERARAAGLADAGDLDALVAGVDVLLVVVPPGAAVAAGEDVAAACRRTGARPLVAELDAVAPGTVTAIAAALPTDLVDGAISGAPPHPDAERDVQIFLSGPRAVDVAVLTAPGVRWIPLDAPVGSASAAKMCTASVRKGYWALMAHALLTADAHGVLDTVVDDLRLDFPDAGVRGAAVATTKAWRFADEMDEIAATQAGAGLTPAMFAGIATVYRDLATSRRAEDRPEDVPAHGGTIEDLRPRRVTS